MDILQIYGKYSESLVRDYAAASATGTGLSSKLSNPVDIGQYRLYGTTTAFYVCVKDVNAPVSSDPNLTNFTVLASFAPSRN